MLEFSPLCLNRLKLDGILSTIIEHVDTIHLDIMDGDFVPNTAFSVESIINFKCNIPKHIHIMANDPISYIEKLKNVDSISFHFETGDTLNVIKKIKDKNFKVGLAISPQTDIEKIFEYVPMLDRVIIMAVTPGFSGQKYFAETSAKIIKLRNFSKKIEIAIDGGMNEHTIREVRTLGADSFIVCSVIVKSNDVISKIIELKKSSINGALNKNLLEKGIK